MKRLAILGASGHGKVVADAAELAGWQEVVFFDDAWPAFTNHSAWVVAGNSKDLIAHLSSFDGVVVAIGDNRVRRTKMDLLESAGADLVVVQHPSAIISRHATVGLGSVIFANVVVNAGAHIGRGVILNTACTVDHDCVLGDNVHISPGANLAGGVVVQDFVWVGIGACVKQGVTIRVNAVVGAGAVVVDDIPSDVTVAGVPARRFTR